MVDLNNNAHGRGTKSLGKGVVGVFPPSTDKSDLLANTRRLSPADYSIQPPTFGFSGVGLDEKRDIGDFDGDTVLPGRPSNESLESQAKPMAVGQKVVMNPAHTAALENMGDQEQAAGDFER